MRERNERTMPDLASLLSHQPATFLASGGRHRIVHLLPVLCEHAGESESPTAPMKPIFTSADNVKIQGKVLATIGRRD